MTGRAFKACTTALGCLSCALLPAQRLSTSLVLSPGISRYGGAELAQIRFGPSFSGGLWGEFSFSKVFSAGLGIEFTSTNGRFGSRLDSVISMIPEFHSGFRHVLSMQSVDIPLVVKVRPGLSIQRSVYLLAGIGASAIFRTVRRTDIVEANDFGGGETIVARIADGRVRMLNDGSGAIGSMVLVGLGKSFPISGSRTFFLEVRYRTDLSAWRYNTVNDPAHERFYIRRHCLQLGLGMSL